MAAANTQVNLTGAAGTLLATLYGRALDARSTHPVLGDTTAAETVARLDYPFDALRVTTGDAVGIALRARRLDDWTRAFLDRHPDAVVLHLGCGLDTRLQRVDPPPTATWWDVDHPDVIALREQLYPPRAGHHTIGASVTDPAWLSRIPTGRPTLVVAEGLLMYLTAADGRRLLTRLVDHCTAGGQLAFDAYSPLGIRLQGLNRAVRAAGATLHWGIAGAGELTAWEPRLHVLEELNAFDVPGRERLPAAHRAAAAVLSRVPGLRDLAHLYLLGFAPAGH